MSQSRCSCGGGRGQVKRGAGAKWAWPTTLLLLRRAGSSRTSGLASSVQRAQRRENGREQVRQVPALLLQPALLGKTRAPPAASKPPANFWHAHVNDSESSKFRMYLYICGYFMGVFAAFTVKVPRVLFLVLFSRQMR